MTLQIDFHSATHSKRSKTKHSPDWRGDKQQFKLIVKASQTHHESHPKRAWERQKLSSHSASRWGVRQWLKFRSTCLLLSSPQPVKTLYILIFWSSLSSLNEILENISTHSRQSMSPFLSDSFHPSTLHSFRFCVVFLPRAQLLCRLSSTSKQHPTSIFPRLVCMGHVGGKIKIQFQQKFYDARNFCFDFSLPYSRSPKKNLINPNVRRLFALSLKLICCFFLHWSVRPRERREKSYENCCKILNFSGALTDMCEESWRHRNFSPLNPFERKFKSFIWQIWCCDWRVAAAT